MAYWLMKSEPNDYSIDDLKHEKQAMWDGVRNYQARNFMRDDMRVGDKVLFYHSNAKPPGVAGVAKVATKSYPDPTAFDKKDSHYDPKSKKDNPTWYLVDVSFVSKLNHFVSLDEIKEISECKDMLLLNRSRLSVQPIDKKHFDAIVKRGSTKK